MADSSEQMLTADFNLGITDHFVGLLAYINTLSTANVYPPEAADNFSYRSNKDSISFVASLTWSEKAFPKSLLSSLVLVPCAVRYPVRY